MKFQKQQITIPLLRKGEKVSINRRIDATVGVGSGLSYHHPQTIDGEDTHLYALTHIASGCGLPDNYLATTEQEAQCWLELVAQITDWTVGREEIVQALRGKPVMTLIGDALEQACQEVENAPTTEH